MGLFSFLFGSDDDVNKYKTNPAAGENAYSQWKLYDDFKNYQTPGLMKKLILNEYNYARRMFEENYHIRKVSASSDIPKRILDIMQRCIFALGELPIVDTTAPIWSDIAYGDQHFKFKKEDDGTQKLYKSQLGVCEEFRKNETKIKEDISLTSYPWRIDPEGNWHKRYEFCIITGTISRERVIVNHCGDDSQVWWSYREAYNKPTNYLSLFGLNY